jgi:hypothetical protein
MFLLLQYFGPGMVKAVLALRTETRGFTRWPATRSPRGSSGIWMPPVMRQGPSLDAVMGWLALLIAVVDAPRCCCRCGRRQ